MNALEAALVDVAGYLEHQGIPYMVIGGFANLHWGRPRLTEDLDLKIQAEEPAWDGVVAGLQKRYRLLAPDPPAFLRQTRVIPLETPTGVRVDLVLAELPYEEEAIRRAETLSVGGQAFRICTAEDLVLHKIISDRSRDRDDVEGVVLSRGPSLDREYLDPRVRDMAAGLDRPDLLDFYNACLKRAGLPEASPRPKSPTPR